jgi:hypothetical protein
VSRRSIEQRLVGERAGRDDAHHLALDRTLRLGRIADLLADRHRFARAHQPREVVLDAVIPARRPSESAARRLPARGQRDVEQRAARRASSKNSS